MEKIPEIILHRTPMPRGNIERVHSPHGPCWCHPLRVSSSNPDWRELVLLWMKAEGWPGFFHRRTIKNLEAQLAEDE